MSRNVCLIAPIILGLMGTARGQETTGRLEGRILNEQGQAIPSANVVVTSPQLQGERGTATNEAGYFRIIALPAGHYTAKISHIAYKITIVENVSIHLGKTTSLGELHLSSRVVALAEVVISGERPIIDHTTTTIGENLRLATIDKLPVARNFRSISALIPQANTSYYRDLTGASGTDEINIGGSTGAENAYFIDGMNVTDPIYATTSTNLPYNFVQEIEIITGGYQAEYGRSVGGIINVITPSGSNEFHGQAFGFFTNNQLGGDPKVGLQGASIDGYSTYDLGLSLSGPIIRDHLWFHAAYNPSFEREEFRFSNLGILRNSSTSHWFAGKLTWRAPGHTDLVLSIFGDPSVQHKSILPWLGYSGLTIGNKDVLQRSIELGGVNSSLQARRAFGQKLLLVAQFSYLSASEKSVPETERGKNEPLIADHVTGTVSGGAQWLRDNKPSRLAAEVSGTLFLGSHNLKMGVAYEDNKLDMLVVNGWVERTGESSYTVFGGTKGVYENTWIGTVHNRIPSLFAQDSWRVSKRLTLNAGLRWDGQYFVGSDSKVAQTITDQFQPRIGFILQPGELGSAKVFASFGRFYEQIPTLFPGANYMDVAQVLTFYDHDPLLDPAGGDTLDLSSSILPEVESLKGQYFDEFILGYERRLWKTYKISIRGLYRSLRQVVENGFDPETGRNTIGNPGRENLNFFPKLKRDYKALEISLQRFMGKRMNLIASYVLSRNTGNYTGLFNAEVGATYPNFSLVPNYTEQIPNSAGLLPNDRPHVFKLSGSYLSDFGLAIGASFLWQSGTPITELGSLNGVNPVFLSERGSIGRTPAIADLNLRLQYDLMKPAKAGFQPTLIVDAFHVFNQRQAVSVDQTHYFARDENGNPTTPNPNYLNPVLFHPARTIRLGMEVKF